MFMRKNLLDFLAPQVKRLHPLERGQCFAQHRAPAHLGSVLRQIADSGPLRSRDSARVDRENLGHHFEQRRFARAVQPDQADASVVGHGPTDAVENPAAPVGLGEVVETKHGEKSHSISGVCPPEVIVGFEAFLGDRHYVRKCYIMAKFAPGYPLPRSSDEFERLCLKLLRRHWQLPQLERFRDPERIEKGINLIEISGRPRLAAVKCDLRDSRSDLTVAEIKDAVDRAASPKLPIGRFVIVTTAAKPEGLQRSLFDLNRANRKDGISAIEVLTWDDIEELLDEYPQILTDFGTAAKRQALTRADAVVHLEARCEPAAVGPSDTLGEEISAAAAFLESRQYQLARLGLLRMREQKWAELSNANKFRVLSYLGVAWLKEGEPRKAAMLFIAAKSLQPDDENACTNEALAHELLGERDRAFALADKLRRQFPSSGRAVALWLNNAPHSFDSKTIEQELSPELTSDPEVAVVMARRALLDAHFARAEHYARLASTALPNSSIPWLVLGQAILLGELEAGGAGTVEAPAQIPDSQDAASQDSSAQNEESRVRESETCFTQAL